MNKKLLIELSIVIIGSLILGGLIYSKKTNEAKPHVEQTCPTDVMMCPDGTSIPRSGPNCEFGVCKQELPQYMVRTETASTTATSSITPATNTSIQPKINTTILKKITSSVTSLFQKTATIASSDVSSGIKQTETAISQQQNPHVSTPNVTTSPQPKPSINETRYTIENNKIIDENKKVIYTLPSSSANSSTSGYTDTHDVNVVPVNDVAPVVGAIPVDGLPGKYYLSENSFNANSECKFANKIYILDTKTGTRTLMYEENSELLAQEDPRSCTSEMFLLATDKEKLVLKYHTVGTNMVCESTWSEPEKTWYLDVTKPLLGTRRYPIAHNLYQDAETKEESCRALIEASSTPSSTATNTTIGG